MILVDYQIRNRCESGDMVRPYEKSLINPASLDLRLGNVLMVESCESFDLVPVDIGSYSEEFPWHLMPGQFCLAETLESFALPLDICGQFVLKSSRAREGLDHLNAGWCDPGWGLGGDECRSVLTMEIKNVRQLAPIKLWPGLKIGQMKFTQLESIPRLGYQITGRYNGDKTVQSSKG